MDRLVLILKFACGITSPEAGEQTKSEVISQFLLADNLVRILKGRQSEVVFANVCTHDNCLIALHH